MADGPAPTGCFANERVEVLFAFGTAARAETNRAKTGTTHEFVEGVGTAGFEDRKGLDAGISVGGLHKDIAHAVSRPIGFKEAWFGVVVAREAGITGDGSLEKKEKF